RRPRDPGRARPRTRSGAPRRTRDVLEQPAAQRGGTARDAAPSVELDEGEIRRDLAQPGAPELTLRARRRLARVLAMKGRFDEALELFGQIEAQYRARSQEDDEATALGDLAAV